MPAWTAEQDRLMLLLIIKHLQPTVPVAVFSGVAAELGPGLSQGGCYQHYKAIKKTVEGGTASSSGRKTASSKVEIQMPSKPNKRKVMAKEEDGIDDGVVDLERPKKKVKSDVKNESETE